MVLDFVNDNLLSPEHLSEIQNTLQNHLQTDPFLTEFMELETNKNLALTQISVKSLVEKIKYSLDLETDETSRKKIQEAILSRVEYEEIGKIAPFFSDLILLNFRSFLSEDFGLPIFEVSNSYENKRLAEHHSELSQIEFYTYYLSIFGVNFTDKEGALDFEKIYEILQFEIVKPFVGIGGNSRDYFTYGIIKVLELHFKTTLGFHRKLNENQTFYTYSATKRAAAWQKYLLDNKLVTTATGTIPSFNVSVD